MKEIRQKVFNEERALYGSRDLIVADCVFESGESPIKECRDLELTGSLFCYKYPIWYSENIKVTGCTWYEMARAGVWYNKNVTINDAVIQAPKNFRRCTGLKLCDVVFTNAEETLWHCDGVELKNVSAKGHYFAMNCSNMDVDGLTLDGNYSFDGVKNAVIRNSRLLTKDSFWNSENVTVYDSFVSGEYLGWNSRGLTLINCTVESSQGMCYAEDIKLVNCRLIDTTLAFEYSTVDAEIVNRAESIFDPAGGRIKAESIGELIVEPDRVDPAKIEIECPDVQKRSEKIDWKNVKI